MSNGVPVLAVRVEHLEEWRREHSQEDDQRYELHETRIRDLELSRARILGWAAGAAAAGAAVTQIVIQILDRIL